ncbi:GNAT family N-acetyltransferase [Providencia sp. wls1914]|jgi:putative acetyltransferase|uniref:GNAT family N-acetyltransferase n=1 Tax=Providencia sp. wls1914 TaxID=2675156 RepID=UPI0012B66AC4|nr:GNAT family N-acetyltransferase [Providencia sp. wls1914]MTC72184.1 GNAT family N-acetyltransferase [Providencia sp. wls1914]
MNIQPATVEHYDEILHLWEASVRATHDFLPEKNIEMLKTPIREQYLPNLSVFVTFDPNGKIAGFLGTGENRLEMLFISPLARGTGIGKQLLNYAIEHLGVNEVDVNEQNPQAVGFYQHMGFVQYARSELDGEGNPFPLLHMRLAK